MGDPTHDKVMRKRPDGQGGSGLEGPPGLARASTPEPESVCLTILCLAPTLLALTGGYPLPGASVRNSTRGKGHEEGGSAYTKVGSSLRRPPVPEHLPPKTRVCLLYCFMLSSTPLTLQEAVSHHLSWEKELTYSSKLIKIPGRDKSVST